MIKKFLFLMVLAAAMVACTNTTDTADNNAAEENVMSVDQLFDNIADLVDSSIVVTGEVDHVCVHGGTKMVIFNPETEKSIHILAGESGNFRADEVKDQDVIVYGKVEEKVVDEAYIDEMQAKLDEEIAKGIVDKDNTEASDKAKDAEHHGEENAAPDNDQKHKENWEARQKQINSLREKLAKLKEEGKDHISYYNVICDSYKVIESEDDDAADVSKDNTEISEDNAKAAEKYERANEATEETKPE